eukprot:Phypoly_transcript_24203.p1 GENE.Phypoly_transcript_24203~~Phypoly_transcript_24203.p1  ORF type:complete len:152 (+),score=25.32 Phypoly_transcript_24203:33-488(+)
MQIKICGIDLAPSSYVVLFDPADDFQPTAQHFCEEINKLTGRVFSPVPTVIYLRNVNFHSSVNGETQSRIPIMIGKNKDVYKLLGFSPEKDPKIKLSKYGVTSGPALLFHGDTQELLSEVINSFISSLSSKTPPEGVEHSGDDIEISSLCL